MPPDSRLLHIGDVVRYARSTSVEDRIEGFINFHHLQQHPHLPHPRLILESGINAAAAVTGRDGPRRPAIVLRSSTFKAGSATTPWHDEFDLDHGHIRYFGDHKASTLGPVGSTRGNRALIETHADHRSSDPAVRAAASPVFVFMAERKGYLTFMGVALIERLEFVVQRDPQSGRSFPNIVVDLNVIRLDHDDAVDFRWIDDRRDPALTAREAFRHAPESWRTWVARGAESFPRIRRRVISSRVLSREDQLPPAATPAAAALLQIYQFYDGRKHAFEELAARVAAVVLGESGGTYSAGWLTRSGGDGGLDFVGRLDVGPGQGAARLVVLGQAKCVLPTNGVSPDQVARLVARLRRGWVGVFVTTGHFSRQAQVEIVDDEYPVVLVAGGSLAEVALRIAEESYGGDLGALLESTARDYEGSITARRPQEITTA